MAIYLTIAECPPGFDVGNLEPRRLRETIESYVQDEQPADRLTGLTWIHLRVEGRRLFLYYDQFPHEMNNRGMLKANGRTFLTVLGPGPQRVASDILELVPADLGFDARAIE